MALDFSDILSKQIGSAPEPKSIPEGTYHGEIVGVPKMRTAKTKEGEKPIAAVTIALLEADDDVDQESLAEAGGLLSNGGDPKKVTKEFWLTEDALYQYDRFFEGMGITGASYTEGAEQLAGRAVTVFVSLDSYTAKDGSERTSNRVQRVFARES